MDKTVQLLGNVEIETLNPTLQLLDGAITGLSFNFGTKVLVVYGSNVLTDRQILDAAVLHPAIDHDAQRAAQIAASKTILAGASGNNVGTMPPPGLTQMIIAIGQQLGIFDQSGNVI